ncbi:MAG: hypothetical protein OXE58_09625 [Acidobacteria bacterium]|nr:hypothetical protein [Acidobacteriota bacterium]
MNINWWRIGRGSLGLAAVAMAYPLTRNVLLLLRQIDATNEGNILGVMLGSGGGGTPGLEHSSSAVLDLVASGCLLAAVIGLLCVLERLQAHRPTRPANRGEKASDVEPAVHLARRERWDRAWSVIRKTAGHGFTAFAALMSLAVGLFWVLFIGSCVVGPFIE